jgi:hypothetical protein
VSLSRSNVGSTTGAMSLFHPAVNKWTTGSPIGPSRRQQGATPLVRVFVSCRVSTPSVAVVSADHPDYGSGPGGRVGRGCAQSSQVQPANAAHWHAPETASGARSHIPEFALPAPTLAMIQINAAMPPAWHGGSPDWKTAMPRRPEYVPTDKAPTAGKYELLNIFGTPTGETVTLGKDDQLPASAIRYRWRLLEEPALPAAV